MIKNIVVGSGLQSVTGCKPYINSNGPCAGQVRYNTANQQMEANDGYTWLPIAGSDLTISLDNEVQEILAWARKKKLEDEGLRVLIEKHPGIKDLKEKLDIMVTLATEEQK